MRTLKYILLILIWLPSALYANLSKYYFNSIDINDGLTNNSVLAITQDKEGFMWFATKVGLNRYDGNRVKVYKIQDETGELLNNEIFSLYQDSEEMILWVGTSRGVYLFDMINETFSLFNNKIVGGVHKIESDSRGNVWIATDRLHCYIRSTQELVEIIGADKEYEFRVRSLYVDKDDQVWVSLNGLGIRKYTKAIPKSYIDITTDNSGHSLEGVVFSAITEYDNNKLICGTINNRLYTLDKLTLDISPIKGCAPSRDIEESVFVRSIANIEGNIWIGTERGLYIHEPKSNITQHITHRTHDVYSLSDNAIYSIFQDKEGGVWLGTYFGGVNYLSTQHKQFEKYYQIEGYNTLKGGSVSGICEDGDGYIWIATEDAGLNRYNPKDDSFKSYLNHKTAIGYHNIHDLVWDGDHLWVGMFNNGVILYDTKQEKVLQHFKKGGSDKSIIHNDVFALYCDKSKNVWIGTSVGASLYNSKSETIENIDWLQSIFVSDINEDNEGNLWFSTYNRGVIKYNPKDKTHRSYIYVKGDTTSLSNNKITSIFKDSQGDMWFTAEQRGICKYNPESDNFSRRGSRDEFSNDAIYKMVEDKAGNYWLSGNSGLVMFDADTDTILNFTTADGLIYDQFNYKSGFVDSNGKVYFGCIGGLVAFYPQIFKKNDFVPPVKITDIKLLDSGERIPYKEYASGSIELPYYNNSIGIEFSALSYLAPKQNEYAYRIAGLEENWNYTNSAQMILYSNLPSGKYQFQLRGANNDGVWNDKITELKINIPPPFWRSNVAFVIYLLLIALAMVAVMIQNSRRIQQQSDNQRVQFEKQKEQELFESQINFFTNIAHEIRTPLTLIKCPIDHILKHDIDKDEIIDNLSVVQDNTNRLHLLISQLLDFRKEEATNRTLHLSSININELVSTINYMFKPIYDNGTTSLLTLPDYIVTASIDKEIFTKIVSNLITNAAKYGDGKIEIILTSNNTNFQLRVNSNGAKIPTNMQERIFEPFVQIKNDVRQSAPGGFGIGLSLALSLAELHNGSLKLDTSFGEGNSFVLEIPLNNNYTPDIIEDSKVEDFNASSDSVDPASTKETILLVEDNGELLKYMQERLKGKYITFKANNGLSALRVLEKERIDIVVSDIMMPEMSGIELCQEMKRNVKFSHIPIILLTAKNTLSSKIEGLESGADAYIEKPFSFDFLMVQISNLMSNRRKMIELFASSPHILTDEVTTNSTDSKFLKRLNEVILVNISNPDFKVEDLASELLMSKSNLLRKIRGISEFSPKEYIKLVRLKRAAEILRQNEYRINEVCFLVGFSSNSYFSKLFKKQFGITPKEFVKEQHGDKDTVDNNKDN